MAIAVRYVLPLVLCQLVVPVVTGTRRLEKEDASAQGAMVNSTHPCSLLGLLFLFIFIFVCRRIRIRVEVCILLTIWTAFHPWNFVALSCLYPFIFTVVILFC